MPLYAMNVNGICYVDIHDIFGIQKNSREGATNAKPGLTSSKGQTPMPMADALSTTHRRSLLAGIMAVPFLASTALAAPGIHSDAALLSVFEQFRDCRKRIDAHCVATNHVFGTPDEQLHEDKLNALVVEQDELVAALAALPATTQAGQRAKATVALTMLRDQIAPGEEELEDSMTRLEVSLLTDLTREAAI